MEPERWRQIDTIFRAALKRDPESRVAFLDGACIGDAELRAEVESLLDAHDEAAAEEQTDSLYFSPLDLALVYAGLGDKDGAFAWLTRAYEMRDPQMIWVNTEPGLESLHADPRFGDLLRRMNLAL